MKKWEIKFFETLIDDFELSENEQDQVRSIIARTHMLENTNKASSRKLHILKITHPVIYVDIMDKYTEKYGRHYYNGGDDEPA